MKENAWGNIQRLQFYFRLDLMEAQGYNQNNKIARGFS